MNKPKVSVLLATYNRSGFLGPTIESVRAQSFQDFEIIIADDGSSDGTPDMAREWQRKDSRVKYIRSEINQGISKNYNMGFGIAEGEYIAMIDDDDPWCDMDKLAKQIKFLDENLDYVGCGGGAIVVNKDGRELYRYLKPETDRAIRNKMLFSNPMANSATMFRKKIGEKIGWCDGSIRYSGDRDFWMKAGLEGKLYNFPEYFTFYTMTGANTSISKLKPHLRTSLDVMKRYRGKYPHYYPALVFNQIQYAYAFLPEWLRQRIHRFLARLKRQVLG